MSGYGALSRHWRFRPLLRPANPATIAILKPNNSGGREMARVVTISAAQMGPIQKAEGRSAVVGRMLALSLPFA